MRRRAGAVLVASAITAAACAPTDSVDIERADTIDGVLSPDGAPPIPDAESGRPRPSPTPSTSTLEWGTCDGFGIPSEEWLGTSRWECTRLAVPMDHDDPGDPDLPPVELALTRHPATGARLGSIVVNPGGPGGAGLPLVWSLRGGMPPEMLRSFDIVSWDPRGVGQSTPAIRCPAGADPDDVDYIERCVDATGPLSTHLAAPYSAHDMESIRVALDEPELNYLGYSYGSVLGAIYAERFPETAGAFVLDGATDPLVGSPDGPFDDGFPTFADDGRREAEDRMIELCNASDRCLAGEDAGDVIERLRDDIADLPTDHFAGAPDAVDRVVFEDLLLEFLVSAAAWELLATALEDAAAGDASVIAALVASDPELAPEGGDGPVLPDDGSAPDNFVDANFLIYCADLGPLIEEWTFCDALPVNGDQLEPVRPVDVPQPILVIGTEYDPLTPGRHAPDFAIALRDATYLLWDGVGHTAFPGWTRCIDDAVERHFLGRPNLPSGTRCSFVEDAEIDEELGDGLFGYDESDGAPWVEDALVFRGEVTGDEASCVASRLVDPDAPDDRVVTHVILDVESVDAEQALDAARAEC